MFWGVWGIQISIKATGQIFPKKIGTFSTQMVQFGTFKVPGAKNGPKNAKIGQKRP